MEIKKIEPPRVFNVGTKGDIQLKDCAHIYLEPDEQITLFTKDGKEYDIARKEWGYYATPSLNKRLARFNLKALLVKNKDTENYFILLVENGKEEKINKYLCEENMKIVSWLDNQETLNKLEEKITLVGTCDFCDHNNFVPIFNYSKPPEGETQFNIKNYKREIVKCVFCNHFFNKHNFDLNTLYSGQYVKSTYAGGEGMMRKFNEIIGLPPERSDNYWRVKRIVEYLLKKTDKTKPKVLDIGSGLCVFLELLKKEGWDCTALDPDARAVEHAKINVGVNAVCADFMKVQNIGNYDLITLNKVLEHVKNPFEMLKKTKSFLNKGGVVYVEVPDGEVAAKHGSDREEFFVEHYHIFSAASLSLMANKAGFQVDLIERLQEPSAKYTLRGFLSPKW